MRKNFFTAALKESLFFPYETMVEIGGKAEWVEAREDQVLSRPETVSRSSLCFSILLGRSSVDMHAIELTKQSCLQSTREEIPNESIRLVSTSRSP